MMPPPKKKEKHLHLPQPQLETTFSKSGHHRPGSAAASGRWRLEKMIFTLKFADFQVPFTVGFGRFSPSVPQKNKDFHDLYKSKSEPLAFLSINHWVSWNDDLVEISIMWSHFVWGSCCKTWDKENRSWVGRRTNFRFMGKKNMEGQNEGLQNLRRFLLNISILAGALGNP